MELYLSRNYDVRILQALLFTGCHQPNIMFDHLKQLVKEARKTESKESITQPLALSLIAIMNYDYIPFPPCIREEVAYDDAIKGFYDQPWLQPDEYEESGFLNGEIENVFGYVAVKDGKDVGYLYLGSQYDTLLLCISHRPETTIMRSWYREEQYTS